MYKDLNQSERDKRLFKEAPDTKIGRSIDQGTNEADQARANVRRGIIALLIVAGGVIAIDQVAQKVGNNFPTTQDIEKWAQDNLHGQLFDKK